MPNEWLKKREREIDREIQSIGISPRFQLNAVNRVAAYSIFSRK